MRYRRLIAPGGTFFFTVVTFARTAWFGTGETVELLRDAFRNVIRSHPFEIDASVILPNHLHMLWTLPEGDSDYPTRWRLIKSNFTRCFTGKNDSPIISSRLKKNEQAVWQRRYWEHQIRDERDFTRHVEYIHYNPVKHGLVQTPAEWKYSSFHRYVEQGLYSLDWGADSPKI